MVELSPSYDNEKFPKIVKNSRHVSSIKQERVQFGYELAFNFDTHLNLDLNDKLLAVSSYLEVLSAF